MSHLNLERPLFVIVIALLFCGQQSLAMQDNTGPSSSSPEAGEMNRSLSFGAAEELGLDVSELKTIDVEMTKQVAAGNIVGCSALIYKDGKEVFYGHWGQSNREKELPLQRDSIFRIYSMSKPITSVAAMQLVEKGKLKLDDPVGKYLPELNGLSVLELDNKEWIEVPAEREISVRDLLRHTSGLTYGFFGNSEVDKRYRRSGVLTTDQTLESTVGKLGKLPLLHHPGSRFHYSVSTDVLGRLVEVVSKQRFDEYLAENIFRPLKMKDTFFAVPTAKLDRLAALYAPAQNGKLRPALALASRRFVNQDNLFFSGGGGLCSTIDDYLQFSLMLLNEGQLNGQRILKPETLKQMFTNQLTTIARPPAGFQFGLGFSISRRGDYSWGGAAGTRFWVNPEKQLAVIYMIQINPYRGRKHGDVVRNAAYKAIK